MDQRVTTVEDRPAVDHDDAPARRVRTVGRSLGGWSATVGAVLLGGFVLVALLGPLLAPYGAAERPGAPFERPSAAFRLGTDDVGKDLLSLLILGTRSSLVVGLGTAAVAIAVGSLAGSVAGLRGGWVDALSMRTVDVVLALPFLPLLIVASTFSSGGLLSQILLIAALTWARPARLIRSAVLEARSRGHVEVAEGMGATRWRVLWRHLSIGAAPLLIPLFLRAAMGAILLEAALAFLGLGDPSRASWGTMLYWANVRSAVLTDAWLWWVLPPGLAIALLIVSMGLVGVAAEERLDPRRSRAVS